MSTNPLPIINQTERHWRATAPGSPSSRQNRSILLVKRESCGDTDLRDLYGTGHRLGSPGYIDSQAIGARLVWDPRLERDCYFLWIWCIDTGHMLWEGCRRAITPTGKYGIHRHGNGCEVNENVIHLIVS